MQRILNVATENNVVAELINKGDNETGTPLWQSSIKFGGRKTTFNQQSQFRFTYGDGSTPLWCNGMHIN